MTDCCWGGNFKEGEEHDWTDPEDNIEVPETFDIVNDKKKPKTVLVLERPALYLRVDWAKYDSLWQQVDRGIGMTRCVEYEGYSGGVR